MPARTALARLIILTGFLVAATSFGLALPLRIPGVPVLGETAPGLVQPIPYLPVVFIVGIMLMFIAAAVYELLPDRTNRQDHSSTRRLRSG